MKCKNCGATLRKTDKFCGACGKKVVTESKTKNKNSDLSNQQSTCTIFGVVGLVLSFFVNILSLPLSIIAIVKGSKLKKITNKTETGFVLGLIGTILSIIFFIFWSFVLIISAIAVAKEVRDYKFSNIEEKIEDILEDQKIVGNQAVGYIYVPKDWRLIEDDDNNTKSIIKYGNDSEDSTVKLEVIENPSFTLKSYQEDIEDKLKAEDTSSIIISHDTYISNKSLKVRKIGGIYKGKYLYTWTFEDSSKNIYCITIESTKYDIKLFNSVDNYKLDYGLIPENTTY